MGLGNDESDGSDGAWRDRACGSVRGYECEWVREEEGERE